jgi:hypothetical protein
MQKQYIAGLYILTREDGDRYHVVLSKNEARALFKVYSLLGFKSIDIETPYN